jgi:hypothetical protein
MTMHQKVNVLVFYLIYAQKGHFKKNSKFKHPFVSACLHLLFPTKFKNLKNIIITFFAMGPCPFLP